jgi:hypothetical protein
VIRVTSLSSVRMRRCRSREAKVARIMLGRSLRVADRAGCRVSAAGAGPDRRRLRGNCEPAPQPGAASARPWRRGLPMKLRRRATCDSSRLGAGRLTPRPGRPTSSHEASLRRPASRGGRALSFVRDVAGAVSLRLTEPSHMSCEAGSPEVRGIRSGARTPVNPLERTAS